MSDTDHTTDKTESAQTDTEERIAHLEAEVQTLREHIDRQSGSGGLPVTRRQTLGLLGGSALLGAASQSAAGRESPRTAKRVTADAINGVLYAKPGEVQEKIDQVATSSDGGPKPNGIVKLLPERTYDEGKEIWVKPSVTLDFNGALLEVSSDHNGLFVDNESKVTNVNIVITDDGYTSDAIVLDASRRFDPEAPDWERAYGPDGMDIPGPGGIAQGGENNGVEIDGKVRGNVASGVGLALRPTRAEGYSRTTSTSTSITVE